MLLLIIILILLFGGGGGYYGYSNYGAPGGLVPLVLVVVVVSVAYRSRRALRLHTDRAPGRQVRRV